MTITEYGAKPHQNGGYVEGRVRRPYHPLSNNDSENRYGPVSVLVLNGKAQNEKGAELLRLYRARAN